MTTDRLSEFKLDTGDEIKANMDCAASGCLKLQCIRNCHIFKVTPTIVEEAFIFYL